MIQIASILDATRAILLKSLLFVCKVNCQLQLLNYNPIVSSKLVLSGLNSIFFPGNCLSHSLIWRLLHSPPNSSEFCRVATGFLINFVMPLCITFIVLHHILLTRVRCRQIQDLPIIFGSYSFPIAFSCPNCSCKLFALLRLLTQSCQN